MNIVYVHTRAIAWNKLMNGVCVIRILRLSQRHRNFVRTSHIHIQHTHWIWNVGDITIVYNFAVS